MREGDQVELDPRWDVEVEELCARRVDPEGMLGETRHEHQTAWARRQAFAAGMEVAMARYDIQSLVAVVHVNTGTTAIIRY